MVSTRHETAVSPTNNTWRNLLHVVVVASRRSPGTVSCVVESAVPPSDVCERVAASGYLGATPHVRRCCEIGCSGTRDGTPAGLCCPGEARLACLNTELFALSDGEWSFHPPRVISARTLHAFCVRIGTSARPGEVFMETPDAFTLAIGGAEWMAKKPLTMRNCLTSLECYDQATQGVGSRNSPFVHV